MHAGRTLVFRVRGGSTTFLKVATATAALEANHLPAGVGLPEDEEEEAAQENDRLRRQDRIFRSALHACNFVDDAYLFASGCLQLS